MAPLHSFTAGALFGTALLASGVYTPSVIVSQMRLDNFHMLQTFLTASSVSAIVITLAQRTGYAPCPARSPSSYGYFPYDANLIGGLLVGIGMALTGACPGTVLVQIATGIPSGLLVGLGGILGGVLYTGFGERLRRHGAQKPASARQASAASSSPSSTLPTLFKASTNTVLLFYEILMLLALRLSSTDLVPRRPHWLHPMAGGLLIGAAQAASIMLTQRPVGVSAAYQDMGRAIWRIFSGNRKYPTASLATPALSFALGIVAGVAVLARSASFADVAAARTTAPVVEPLRAVAGGVALVVGAGLAGGCPSGHGITGMATFGIASFVSVAAMFGGGIAVALAVQ